MKIDDLILALEAVKRSYGNLQVFVIDSDGKDCEMKEVELGCAKPSAPKPDRIYLL